MKSSRTLWIALLAGGAAVMILTIMKKPQPGAQPTGPASSTQAQPASAPAQKTAVASPAAPGSTTRPAPLTGAAATTAEAAGKVRWLDDRASRSQKLLLGSLGPKPKPADRKNEYPFQVELSSRGAAIHTLKLRGDYAKVADKRLGERDWKAYEKALHSDLQKPQGKRKYGGPYSLMNPVSDGRQTYQPLATRELKITFPDGKIRSWHLESVPWTPEPSVPQTQPDKAQSARFGWTLYRNGVANPVLKLIKTYTVRKGDYTIYVSLEARNLSAGPLTIRLDQAGPTGVPREDYRTDMRRAGWGKLSAQDARVKASFMARKPDPSKMTPAVKVAMSGGQDPGVWVGQTNKFFGSMMYLVPAVKDRLQAPTWNAEFWVIDALESPVSTTQRTEIRIPNLLLQPGKSRKVQFELFAGPKRLDTFDDDKSPYFRARYRELDYISTIDLRSCFCSSDWLSFKMIQLLELFGKVTFGNYGLAIMLLMVLVRVLLHPLTKKGQVMMSKMKS